jgi:hypothetical protein
MNNINKYQKPAILAQSAIRMAECRPNSKPSGRPCNPPAPTGREYPLIPTIMPKKKKIKIKIFNFN